MKIARTLRIAIAIGIVLATLVLLMILFFATKGVLDLWDRLQALPDWMFYGYLGLVGLVVLGSGWLVWRLLLPKKTALQAGAPLNEQNLLEEIKAVEDSGLDLSSLRDELARLHARKAAGQVHIAFFGDISTGKSSIIKALVPNADILVDVRGGSTREIHEYRWKSSVGDELLLTDLPGRNETEGVLDQLAQEEALRAQIVVYVTDSDLNRTQFADIQTLYQYQKPTIIAVNKSDLYTSTEQEQIRGHILGHFPDPKPEIVFIQSGGEEEVIRVKPDGSEETFTRPRPIRIEPLAQAMQYTIDNQLDVLEQLRDSSVFNLVKNKLDQTKIEHRLERGEKIVTTHTRNAVIGAMAAMAPGTDIIIQGIIGTRMIQELCKLYDTPISQLDIDQFLDFSQGQLKKTLPIILAVIGNIMKAFPGIGTVAGGMVQAVAYGLIFDALGHAVLHTLEQRGELKAAPAAITFREMLSGNLEERTKTFTRLVVNHYKSAKQEQNTSNGV